MQNHNDDTIKTSDTILEKNIPLTLFERVVCERELETEQNYNILTPTLMAISVSFPFSWTVQPGACGPASLGAGFLYRILSPTRLIPNWSDLQTDWTSCAPSYTIVHAHLLLVGVTTSHPLNPFTVKVIISWSTGCTCYLHRCIFYFDCPAKS